MCVCRFGDFFAVMHIYIRKNKIYPQVNGKRITAVNSNIIMIAFTAITDRYKIYRRFFDKFYGKRGSPRDLGEILEPWKNVFHPIHPPKIPISLPSSLLEVFRISFLIFSAYLFRRTKF